MSGTSLDGVDGVLAEFSASGRCRVLAHHHLPYSQPTQVELLALNTPGANELHRSALAANKVADAYAEVVHHLLRITATPKAHIRAIGAHGQTVRHRPGEFDGRGYTLQLLNAALLAEQTDIDVVCDFRSRDVAAGGQGAPLVPGFHQSEFSVANRDIAVLNIGGIANVTFLYGDGRVSGHDCGPGNVLMDLWTVRHTGRSYDESGRWAASGKVNESLLNALLADAFFRRLPPKSTGRDLFHGQWLDEILRFDTGNSNQLSPRDVQSTLAKFTASAVAADILRYMPATDSLLVCGGGAMNQHLMHCLSTALPNTKVLRVDARSNLDVLHVEAAAFAWLARGFYRGDTGNRVSVTGAAGPRILGARYPGYPSSTPTAVSA